MPARVIRGEINSSRSLAKVSLQADLTFRALLVAMDDYGRCDADPLMLKADLFPRRPEVTPEMVRDWVEELIKVGCLELYVVNGAEYLRSPTWERYRGKTKRAEKSRFPDPPADPRGSPRIPADPIGDPRIPARLEGVGVGGGECVAGAESDPASPEPERSPLLNLLSKLDGSPREKELWLAETGPQIKVDALASKEIGKPQTEAQLTMRYYRAYLRRPEREFRAKAEAEAVREKVAAWRSRPDPERDAAIAAAEAERARGPSAAVVDLFADQGGRHVR